MDSVRLRTRTIENQPPSVPCPVPPGAGFDSVFLQPPDVTMRHPTTVVLFAFFIVVGLSVQSVRAQPTSDASVQFSVEEPPSGALNQSQLSNIAETIRRLEKHPTAEGAQEGRRTLIQWLQASPDVTVTICPSIASPFSVGESPALRSALQQHLLSTAAYEIEHPEAARVEAKLSGLEGALQAYQLLTGGSQNDYPDGIQKLLTLQKEGKLKAHVEKGVEQCEGKK